LSKLPIPDVVTEWYDETLNFTLRIHAFQHVNQEEMTYCFREWMRVNRFKELPRNKIGEVLSLFCSEPR
jgi:hypothetical protein